MRYLLVDRIVEWRAGQSIRGLKNVAMSEDFLEFHFPKNPVMPGVLILEALVQLSGWLEAASSDFQNWFLLEKVHHCHFYGFAFPGDSIELCVEGQRANDDTRLFTGVGTVNRKKKIVTTFEGRRVPLAEIEDVEEQKNFFRLLSMGKKIR